eukprot:5933813-Amphidinium_carterae.1
MVDFVTWLGCSRISVRIDCEPPITALMAAVAARLRAANIDCTPRGGPTSTGSSRIRCACTQAKNAHPLVACTGGPRA